MALAKPKGGLRPIAIGEILRRIAGKCLCAVVKEEAQTFFPPLQVGVACPAGADAAVHSCRDWVLQHADNNDKALLKLDFSNAFNTVNREYVLQEVRTKFPGLARFAHWCYSQESKLFFGSHTIASASGVQQGDPLGPLLFALAVQPLAKELKDLASTFACSTWMIAFLVVALALSPVACTSKNAAVLSAWR